MSGWARGLESRIAISTWGRGGAHFKDQARLSTPAISRVPECIHRLYRENVIWLSGN